MSYSRALSLVLRLIPLVLEVVEALKDKKLSHVEITNLVDSALRTALEGLKSAE